MGDLYIIMWLLSAGSFLGAAFSVPASGKPNMQALGWAFAILGVLLFVHPIH